MLRKGMRRLWDLSSLRPVLCADAKINSNAQAQSQHPVKWDECDVEKIYIYKAIKINGLSNSLCCYFGKVHIYICVL